MNAARALLAELIPLALDLVVDALERDAKLAARLRAVFAVDDVSDTVPIYLARRAYAARVDMAARTIDRLLAQGLPHIGTGKLLRVDVRAADAWLRANLTAVTSDDDDEVVQLARANARGARR